jgi:hypothetical protein
MNKLTPAEQREIDAAQRDNDGWALPHDTPTSVLTSLKGAGLIRFWKDRWQLTPVGYAHTTRFRTTLPAGLDPAS